MDIKATIEIFWNGFHGSHKNICYHEQTLVTVTTLGLLWLLWQPVRFGFHGNLTATGEDMEMYPKFQTSPPTFDEFLRP